MPNYGAPSQPLSAGGVPSHDQVGFPHLTVTVGVICAAGGGSVSVGVRARDVAVCLLPAAEEIPPEARLDVSRRTRTTPRRSGADRPMRVISRPRSCESHMFGWRPTPTWCGVWARPPRRPSVRRREPDRPRSQLALLFPFTLTTPHLAVAARDFESNSTRGQRATACPRQGRSLHDPPPIINVGALNSPTIKPDI
ncbi:hypothetical protein PVAP13_3KG209427 [Panicum virgatum]|uniref:Uncharacterized protein n=1 Tax=Panicum virgatum TaxID=38727 RepID=A0A8T0UTB7_PANVG|nr:hypothetical protein PVAP13_3KG209427 [Panicum virgatum]